MRSKRTSSPTPTPSFLIQPKTDNQRVLLDAIFDYPMTIATGPAGTGKTYIGVQAAAELLRTKSIRRIVLTRANVPTGRSLGFFPGSIEDKLAPWLAPMLSELRKAMGPNGLDMALRSGAVTMVPLETIRGASYESTVVLIDESQNLTYEEVKAVSTRLGEGSKMVFMGDPVQRDVKDSGLVVFEEVIRRYDLPIPVVRFTVDDIVRSDLVGLLVRAFMKKEGLV